MLDVSVKVYDVAAVGLGAILLVHTNVFNELDPADVIPESPINVSTSADVLEVANAALILPALFDSPHLVCAPSVSQIALLDVIVTVLA